MLKGKLFCIGIIPILLCSITLLLLTLAMEWRDIEQKVKQSAITALNAPQHAWAEVETYNRGRQVLITGAAPSQSAIDEAITQVKSASGVLLVSHNGEALAPAPSEPARLTAKLNNGQLRLNGVVSSKTEADELVSMAIRHFGEENVTHNLTHSADTKAVSQSNFLTALFLEQDEPANLNLRLEGSELRLNGVVATQNAYEHVSKTARGFSVQVSQRVKFVPPTPKLDCARLVQELLQSAKINFATGNAQISTNSHDLLDKIGSTAEKCPDARFSVIGHTDASGNEAFNIKLSQRRAQAVVEYLVGTGLAMERFNALGRGSATPIADNATNEGRAANRRIEFKLEN